jgi:hypothetical protein
MDKIKSIFESGKIELGRKGTVCFTEIPIGELDRMKLRHGPEEQVAIGFPRRYLEHLGFSPVLYLKHSPELRSLISDFEKRDPVGFKKMEPFIERDDDVSPFLEIRTTSAVDIDQAVWLLTTTRDKDSGKPLIPDKEIFWKKYGAIAISFWHRTHQLGVLTEWQFTKLTIDDHCQPTDFEFIGEHYWRQEVTRKREMKVVLPKHDRTIEFDVVNEDAHNRFEGPWRFIDVAMNIYSALVGAGESPNDALRYRLIPDIGSGD